MSREENNQLAINMIAQIGVFTISLGISFFLTPYIVKNLGVDAYGFVALSNTIIGYMQIITVALNSMAGRFITIEYHKGNLNKANQYFSSVFYANCVLGGIILLICIVLLYYLEHIINIPEFLIPDVKWLFFLLSINTVLTLLFNVFIVPPFIKNRLEITATRNLISTIIRLVLLLVLFSLFSPHLWLLGVAAILCSIYLVVANILITKKLTPDLHISFSEYNWNRINEVLTSGVWNLVNRISVMMEKGFDLLLANWLINSFVMGLLSISAQISILIPQMFGLITSSFAPSITEFYSKGDIDGIKRNVFKSIRLMSFMTLIPLSFLYVYGNVFFELWLPDQDSNLLQLILVLTTFDFIFGMPLEIFWNVFTATNKIKVPALVMLATGGLTFITLIFALSFTSDILFQIIILTSTRAIWNTIKNLTFLPIYGAHCLHLKWTFFYKSMLKPILGILTALSFCQLFRLIYEPTSWIEFLGLSMAVILVALIIGGLFILTKEDTKFLMIKLHLSNK